MVKIPAKLEHYNIESLIPYERNSRIHSDEQIARIAASIQEFGFTNPILVDGEHGIIAGHGRLAAAKKLGMEKVPVIQLAHLSDAQKQAYIIADNRLAELSEWNKELLAEELAELRSFDFDLSLIGFDDASLAEIMPAEKELQPLTDEDDVPEVDEQATPKTKIGDVWILGNHKIMCGDSTDEAMVAKLMNGVKADVVFTDPPYNINFKPPRGTHDAIENDNMTPKDFMIWLSQVICRLDENLRHNSYLFVWCGWSTIDQFAPILRQKFTIKAMPIWVKNNFGIGYYTRPKYEPFFLCLKGEPEKPTQAPSDVWECAKVHKTIHSCEKPVELISRILETYGKADCVLDLFLGSGSTLIACENTERKCYGMELSPQYVELIIRRWQEYTGKEAHLEATGETFNSIASR